MVSCYTGFVLVQTWSVVKLLSECTILRELIARGLSTVTSTGTTVQTLHGHVWFCQGSPNTWRGPHVIIIIGSRGPLSHGVPKFFRHRVSAHGRSIINPRSSPYYWVLARCTVCKNWDRRGRFFMGVVLAGYANVCIYARSTFAWLFRQSTRDTKKEQSVQLSLIVGRSYYSSESEKGLRLST